MKPRELLAMTPDRISNEFDREVIRHMPEINERNLPWDFRSNRFEILYYRDHCFDGRRTWTLASAWFDGVPFMITQNAGREGDDHERRFLVAPGTYQLATSYVLSLCVVEAPDVVGPDDEISDLTEFYSCSLEDIPSRREKLARVGEQDAP